MVFLEVHTEQGRVHTRVDDLPEKEREQVANCVRSITRIMNRIGNAEVTSTLLAAFFVAANMINMAVTGQALWLEEFSFEARIFAIFLVGGLIFISSAMLGNYVNDKFSLWDMRQVLDNASKNQRCKDLVKECSDNSPILKKLIAKAKVAQNRQS